MPDYDTLRAAALHFLQAPATILPIWLALSACVGSFLSMLVYRLPLILDEEHGGPECGLSLSRPASRCANCATPLRWWQNIPFLGFALSRVHKPCCDAVVPWRYLWLEAVATAWGLLVWLLFEGQIGQVWAWSIFGWFLLACAVVDARSQWLPDRLTVPLLWTGLVASVLGATLVSTEDAVLVAVATFASLSALNATFRALRGQDGLGGGDIKLMAAFACWMPPLMLAMVYLLANLGQVAWLLGNKRSSGPLGPSLCSSAAAVVLARWLGLF